MTNEELIELYKLGDKKALEKIIEENKGLIYKVSMRFFLGHDNAVEREDLLQEGRIGIIEATKKYKNDMNVLFTSYAYYWVYKCMYRFMYSKKSKINYALKFISLNVTVDEESEIELGDTIKCEECSIEESVYYQDLKRELIEVMEDNLDEQEKEVIYLRYGFYQKIYTLQQIGENMHLPREKIRLIEMKSLKKLRTCKWGKMKILERRAERKIY